MISMLRFAARCSMPSMASPAEEPTREKMGWTLDAAVVMESYLYNFDALNTYKKALRDFQDSQCPGGAYSSTCRRWGGDMS